MVGEFYSLGRFFELTTSNKIYVNGLKAYKIKNGFLEVNTVVFEITGSMLIDEKEQQNKEQLLELEMLKILRLILTM